jgi:peptidoglycan/LPS O-acetylase OafA/YrhL
MKLGMSLYLDVLRLLAALEVFFFHLANFKVLGIEPAAWNRFGHEAVVIFFVLSGFVIRHAADGRNSDFRSFAISRISRIYSVAIPCLALTWLFDVIGLQLNTALYAELTTDGSSLLRLAIGALMLNETWVSVQMLSNTPYWSISYEFWYYFIFAALFYWKGYQRWLGVIVFAAIAGPRILLLFPIWILGWIAYRETMSLRFPKGLAWLLFLQPVLVFIIYEQFKLISLNQMMWEPKLGYEFWRNSLHWSRYVLTDMMLGLSIALHLIGAKSLDRPLELLLSWAKAPIRYFAGQSFTLYLLHQPAMLFAGALLGLFMPGKATGLAVALVTLLIIFVTAHFTEAQRYRLKEFIERSVSKISQMYQLRSKPQ